METGHQKLAQEKDFYGDLDRQKTHTSCSCQALIFIFVFMLIISIGLSYYAVTSLQHLNMPTFKYLPFHKKSSNKADTVTLYQSDLQSKISGKLGSLIPLKNKQILIKPEGLILNGDTSYPSQKLSFIADPVIKNQKIALENIRLQNNSANLGSKFSNLIYSQISRGVAASINSLVSFHVSDIQLKDGEMILTVY